MRSTVVKELRILHSWTSHRRRRPFSSSPFPTPIDTLNTAIRPFPDYCPKKPSIRDAEFVNTITTTLKQRRSHHIDSNLLPFADRIRSDHLVWSLSQLRSYPVLALSFIHWFRRRARFVPSEAQAIAVHLALASYNPASVCQLLRQGFASCRNFIEQVIYTYRYWSSDPSVFDLLFRVAVELGRTDDAQSLFHRLTTFGVLISAESCNTILSHLPIDAALSVFIEFPLYGLCWNTSSYNILICGLCRAGRLAEAREFFLKMNSNGGGVLPDVITYSTIIDGYCHAGELPGARDLFDEMQSIGLRPNAFTFNSIMAIQCKNGMVSDAERLLLEMKNKGVAPDSAVYTTLISGFSKSRNLSAVFRMVDEMKGKGLVPDAETYTSLICCLCRCSRITDAEILSQEMLRKGLAMDLVSYTALIDGYCKNGRMKDAFRLHEEMLRVGLVPNIVTYTALADGLCKHGDLEAANELLHEMCGKGLELNVFTYNSLINGLCKSGNIEQAMKTLEDMEAAGLSPDSYTYTTLIDAFCKLGELARAHRLLKEMLKVTMLFFQWKREDKIKHDIPR